jgi:hypothetical protein
LVSDARILGGSDFVSRLLSEKGEGIHENDLRSGSRRKQVVEARKLFCQWAVKKMGYPGAGVAQFLGVITSAVNKAVNSEEVSSLKRYL